MKCNAIVVYGWKSKKSKDTGKPAVILGTTMQMEIFKEYYKNLSLTSHAEECGGKIIAQIEIDEIPYMGGVEHTLEVRFICNKCGYNHAGERGLPEGPETLNEFLTKVVQEMKGE